MDQALTIETFQQNEGKPRTKAMEPGKDGSNTEEQ
jgi:hypothetical protein